MNFKMLLSFLSIRKSFFFALFFIGLGQLPAKVLGADLAEGSGVLEQEPDQRLLSLLPYSQRALGFAQVYSKLSDHLHAYIGQPAVITTLAFEAHVVKDVSLNLEFLEKGIQVAKALRATKDLDFSQIGIFFAETFEVIKSKEAQKGIYEYGLKPFFENPPWKWGWHHLDDTISDLEAMYENMSAMNMHIFRYMTTPGVSALGFYFQALKDKGDAFDGWVHFPEDHNGILREAFHRLFLLKKSPELYERQRLSYEFSVLMIAFEQIYAQKYYDQITRPHEKLAGSFAVSDPVGHYALAKASWADFRVRFSLPLDRKIEMNQVTAKMILNNSMRVGTIPHYYFSRITSPKASLMLKAPAEVLNFRANYVVSPESGDSLFAVNLLNQKGCLGCHSHAPAGGTGLVGPDLTRIGSRLDRGDIEQSILEPNALISDHCPGSRLCPADVMPRTYRQTLTATEIQTIIDYLSKSR